MKKLEEFLSIFDILKHDIHFLLFSDNLNINLDEEFKIRDEIELQLLSPKNLSKIIRIFSNLIA